MIQVNMQYQYSTKNKHRFGSATHNGAVTEVYVSKAIMAQPVSEIQVVVTPTVGSSVVAQRFPEPKA